MRFKAERVFDNPNAVVPTDELLSLAENFRSTAPSRERPSWLFVPPTIYKKKMNTYNGIRVS